MEKITDSYCGEPAYRLSDEEVEYLENINKKTEEKVDEDKKVIIDQYKRQLDIISEVQEDLSIAFENCEINIDEYMEGMSKTNDRAMAIINQLKIESEYIPF